LSARDIAKKIGKSHEHVNQTLTLLKLDKNLKEKVANGLPPSKAIEISETLISAANKFNEENLNIKISVISKENISILAQEEVLIECIKKIKKNKTDFVRSCH